MKTKKQVNDVEIERIHTEWKSWLKAEKLKITHPSQIPDWFLTNQKKIMEGANATPGIKYWHYPKFVEQDNFEGLCFDSCLFKELVSNSHSCPEDGIENFMRDPSKPLGYVGWTGYLAGSLKRPSGLDSSYPYGAALNAVGIHTGSGGGGNRHFRYDFRIYVADWPGLQAEADRILNQMRLDAIRARRKEAVAKIKYERAEIVRRLQGAGRGIY